MKRKYLLIANDKGKVIEFETTSSVEEYGEILKKFADVINEDWTEVCMYPLHKEMSYLGLYWEENYTERGAIFKVFIPSGTPESSKKRISSYLNSNRDVLAINFVYYDDVDREEW